MAQFFENITLGFCWWDLPALILIIGVVTYFSVKKHNLKKKKEELESQRSN